MASITVNILAPGTAVTLLCDIPGTRETDDSIDGVRVPHTMHAGTTVFIVGHITRPLTKTQTGVDATGPAEVEVLYEFELAMAGHVWYSFEPRTDLPFTKSKLMLTHHTNIGRSRSNNSTLATSLWQNGSYGYLLKGAQYEYSRDKFYNFRAGEPIQICTLPQSRTGIITAPSRNSHASYGVYPARARVNSVIWRANCFHRCSAEAH